VPAVDHVSEAVKRIAKAEQEAADVRMVVSAVGDRLASEAKYLHSRIYAGTIGGLSYEGTAGNVQAYMDQLRPVPLEYRLPTMWAGSVKPRSLPLSRDEQELRQRMACAPWFIKAWAGQDWGPTCEVEWYTAVPHSEMLIHCEVKLTDAHKWVRFWKKPYDTHRYWSQSFNGANISTASGGDYKSWPSLIIWWPEGTPWQDAIHAHA